MSAKEKREKEVLLGLIELYLADGKPIGSATLKQAGFEKLSAATIRNYLARFEKEGYLHQEHASAGRIPTMRGLRYYFDHLFDREGMSHYPDELLEREEQGLPPLPELEELETRDTRALVSFLRHSGQWLSEATSSAVFLSAPRFDRDFVTDIKLVRLDSERMVAVVVTDFGLVQSELLSIGAHFSSFSLKRMENYFQWRLHGRPLESPLDPREEELAERYYNELIVSYLVNYSYFTKHQITYCGLGQLIESGGFTDMSELLASFALFEDEQCLRQLLLKSSHTKRFCSWIGQELSEVGFPDACCSVMVAPYVIGAQTVGAIGLLGPLRMDYRKNIALLQGTAFAIGRALTRNVYKYKITYRQPHRSPLPLTGQEQRLLVAMPVKLLADQREVT